MTTVQDCGQVGPVACPVDGKQTSVVSTSYSDPVTEYGRGWRWTSPAVCIGWHLACGHFVEAAGTELRCALRADEQGMAYWFADEASAFVLPNGEVLA